MPENFPDLQFVLCPGSRPDPRYFAHYQKIYKCWSDVWTEAFIEQKAKRPLHSDTLTRQDYIGAIFHKDACVAMGFFRWVDAKSPDFAKDSYFSNWSPSHLQTLTARGNKIIICSQFTIRAEARGEKLGVSGKLLTMGMVVETYLHSRADSMAGAGRMKRNVGGTAAYWGAEIIDSNVPCEFEDETVELLGYYKDKIAAMPEPELKPLIRKLWKERIVISRVSLENEFDSQETERFLKIA